MYVSSHDVMMLSAGADAWEGRWGDCPLPPDEVTREVATARRLATSSMTSRTSRDSMTTQRSK